MVSIFTKAGGVRYRSDTRWWFILGDDAVGKQGVIEYNGIAECAYYHEDGEGVKNGGIAYKVRARFGPPLFVATAARASFVLCNTPAATLRWSPIP